MNQFDVVAVVAKKVLVLASSTPYEILPVAAVDEAKHLTARFVRLESNLHVGV